MDHLLKPPLGTTYCNIIIPYKAAHVQHSISIKLCSMRWTPILRYPWNPTLPSRELTPFLQGADFLLNRGIWLPSSRGTKTYPSHSLSCGLLLLSIARASHQSASRRSAYLSSIYWHSRTIARKGQPILIASHDYRSSGSKPLSLSGTRLHYKSTFDPLPRPFAANLCPRKDIRGLLHL